MFLVICLFHRFTNQIRRLYDTQESIYNWMLKEADDLIALYNDSAWINNPTNKTITVKMDRILAVI